MSTNETSGQAGAQSTGQAIVRSPDKPIEVVCTVTENINLTDTVFLLKFDLSQAVPFKPGQYISTVIPGAGVEGRNLRRPYSVASGPEDRSVELCIKLVDKGPGSTFLKTRKPGDTFSSFFPYGHFVYVPKPERNLVFLATGTGISPFRSFVRSELFKNNRPKKVTTLFGVREDTEILFKEEFLRVEGMKFIECVSRPESPGFSGYKGRITDYLKQNARQLELNSSEFYLCGNGAMISEMKEFLMLNGVEKTSIHQEIYFKPKVEPAAV